MLLLQVAIVYSLCVQESRRGIGKFYHIFGRKTNKQKKTVRLYGNADLDDSQTMTVGSSNERQSAAKSKKLDLDLTPIRRPAILLKSSTKTLNLSNPICPP